MINYIYDKSPEENESHMTQEMMKIKSGEVTYAVRDTTYEGKVIKQNDIMGIGDKGIAAVGKDIEETALELADTMIDKDTELVSIYYGADRNEEQAAKLADMISEKHSGIDVETNQGGQPIYYYVISAE
jgi:dihydroxyacetone kinase-like predicted kinase